MSRISYKPGWMDQPGMLFCKLTSSGKPTQALQPMDIGVAAWLSQSARASGGLVPWPDVLRMAVYAARHNPAARADLIAALAGLPDADAVPAPAPALPAEPAGEEEA